MTKSARRRVGAPGSPRFAAVLLAALLGLLVPACDNPACVFGPTGCNGQAPGGSSGVPATVPVDYQWIQLGSPTITATIPASISTTLHPDSPVALVFSESMSASSLNNALLIQDPASGGFGPPMPFLGHLVGDGRVFVIAPIQPLALGLEFDLIWDEDAVPVDLQGQPLGIPTTRIAASFRVAATAPATVRFLGSYPVHLAINQGTAGEFVALFDRRLNPTSITPTSFDVRVGGVQPLNDPLAEPLSSTDTRAYRWRSADSSGVPVPLPAGQEVEVSLSPTGSKITAVDTTILVPVSIDYDLAAISPPIASQILSMPTDAIGIDNVSGPKTLDIEVTLADVQDDDRLGAFIFGNSVGLNPKLIVLFRETTLSGPATVVHLGEDELDLADDQGEGKLADGPIHIAWRIQRGSVITPVRLLDADPMVDGVQSILLDTTRPTLTGLGPTGTDTQNFRSDLRDFALVGRASERIRSVEVTTLLGDNGILTPVVGSTPTGLFVASPILLGNLTPAELPLAFTAVIYDNALNSAANPIAGNFVQVGQSGPGAPLPGPTVTVDVFDRATFAPVAGALVLVHEDIGGGTIVPVESVLTDPQGVATLSAALAGETIVTVDLAGYDLFTFEDVPTDRLSVPLTRSGAVPASVAGVVSSTDETFADIDRFVVDSRRLPQVEPLIAVQSCTLNPGTQSYDCAFGPGLIRGSMLGIASLFGAEIPPTELSYNAISFLRAFQIAIPVAPVGGGAVSTIKLVANTLLDSPGLDVEERTIDGPAIVLDLNSTGGIALGSLSGGPRVLVEAQVRGMPGAGTVGLGVAFDQGGNAWRVRSAYPGAVDGIQDTPQDELGAFVADGIIDPDLRLSCEVRDSLGARAGRRRRFSQLSAIEEPVSAPVITAPLPGGSTGGASFDLVFTNAIPDSAGTPGLYRATLLAGAGGRAWTLWRPDLGDGSGATRTIHVPDLAGLGGTGLPDGSLTAVVEAFGWPGFAAADFLWSDVEREYDSFSASAPSAFTQP